MTVRSGDAVVAEIAPARRQFAARQMTTTQAGLATLELRSGLCLDRRSDARRRRARPPLLEAAGDADLARRRRHGARRRLVARRPAPSPRRRGAREGRRRLSGAACAMIMRLTSLRSFRHPRACVGAGPRRAAGRGDEGPGAGSARARALGRVALPGLPEPVDRRFRRAARARHPHPHSKPHRTGRKQRRGARLSRLALRRFHPPQAAVQAGDLALVAEPAVDALRRSRRRAARAAPRAPRRRPRSAPTRRRASRR